MLNRTPVLARRAAGLICAALVVASPALGAPDTTAKSGKDAPKQTTKRGQQAKPGTRPTSGQRGAPELRVAPAKTDSGAQGAPQSPPPGVRVDKGPDGKPIILGPDGKPMQAPAAGPDTTRAAAPTGAGPTAPGAIVAPGGLNVAPANGDVGALPGGLVTMDFRGADVNNVLKLFAMAANWQVVPDPGLTGQVTIISTKQLTIDQAFEVLQSTLEVRGFSGQIEKRGQVTVLKIVPLDRAVQSTLLLGNGGQVNAEGLKNQVVTQVIPIENVDAKALATELTPLINKGASLVGSAGTNALIVTDTASNVQRISMMVEMLDKAASNNDIRRFALQNSDATDVASAINSLFRQVFARGQSGAQPGQPGQPQPPPQPGQPQPGGAQARAAIIAVPDTRTNSVLVVASKDNMERVAEIVQELDDPLASAMTTKIVKMKYADATDVADTINGVLSGTNPSRSGNASFASRIFGGFNPFGGGQQGGTQSTDPFAKVVANQRTNALIITATAERMAKIDELIKELDVDVPVETTTFVIPLRNAQAQDVAYILGQAFGTGSNNNYNPYGGFYGGFSLFGNNQRQQRQPINRRLGSNSSRAASRAAAIQGGAQPVTGAPMVNADGVHGTMTPQGFVPDPNSQGDEADPSRQYYGGYGGYYGGRQQNTPQYGRGQNGTYANLLQLRNNVTTVADPGSNSIIVTTTPDTIQAIRQIIDSLDVVPRQVMMEVIIAEATVDAAQKLGFQFDGNGIGRIFGHDAQQSGSSNFPLGGAGNTNANIASPIIPGAQYGLQALSGKFNALVQALGTDNRVRILSTPKVFTSNNMEAQIEITTNVPYVTNSYTGGLNIGSSVNYDFLPVGVTLDVTPRITKDGLVTIDVSATASELLGFDTLTSTVDSSGHATTIQAPRTSQRYADTSVSVRDGEIVALGGLMRDTKNVQVNKIPLLGDIPLLGHLFRSTSTSSTKTELMIFMIPHVVDGEQSNRALIDNESKAIKRAFPNLQKDHPELDSTRPLPQVGPLPMITLPNGRQPAQPNQPAQPGQGGAQPAQPGQPDQGGAQPR